MLHGFDTNSGTPPALTADERVVWAAKDTQGELITYDVGQRVMADAWQVRSRLRHVETPPPYTGITQLTISPEEAGRFQVAWGQSSKDGHSAVYARGKLTRDDRGLPFLPNQFVRIFQRGLSEPLYVVRHTADGYFVHVPQHRKVAGGIKPLDYKQACALDLLMNGERRPQIVTLAGRAGTGKTLLAIAAALQLVHDGAYSRILCFRPNVPLGGDDIGYLKGNEQQKLSSWEGPFRDNLVRIPPDFIERLIAKVAPTPLAGGTGTTPKAPRKKPGASHSNASNAMVAGNPLLSQLKAAGVVEGRAPAFARGASFGGAVVIYDETQSFTDEQALALLSRGASDSLLIALGDPRQYDRRGAARSGFTTAIEKLSQAARDGHPDIDVWGHIQLTKVHRSRGTRLITGIFEQ